MAAFKYTLLNVAGMMVLAEKCCHRRKVLTLWFTGTFSMQQSCDIVGSCNLIHECVHRVC